MNPPADEHSPAASGHIPCHAPRSMHFWNALALPQVDQIRQVERRLDITLGEQPYGIHEQETQERSPNAAKDSVPCFAFIFVFRTRARVHDPFETHTSTKMPEHDNPNTPAVQGIHRRSPMRQLHMTSIYCVSLRYENATAVGPNQSQPAGDSGVRELPTTRSQ